MIIPYAIAQSFPLAPGTGDELEFMMRSLAQDATAESQAMLNQLGKITGRRIENPKRIPVLFSEELMQAAWLLTGTWGPQRTPVRGKTGPRIPFLKRMFLCRQSIEEMLKKAKAHSASAWIRELPKIRHAIDFVLHEGIRNRSIYKDGLPFGLKWGILQFGNGKLPFLTYVEMPMATCPGAGDCARYQGEGQAYKSRTGWCYSFKGWRNPNVYTRQFLNTLAHVADDAFAEMAHKSPERINPTKEVRLGPGRTWVQYVKCLILAQSASIRKTKPCYMRLFVDGDFRDLNALRDWMQACHDMGPGSPELTTYGGVYHVEVYGYSKAWNLFYSAAKGRMRWPKNYSLNMSGGSIYWSKKARTIQKTVEKLPITRGYFAPMNLKKHLTALIDITHGKRLSTKVTDAQARRAIEEFAAIRKLSTTKDVLRAAVTISKRIGLTTPDVPASIRRADVPDRKAVAEIVLQNWLESLRHRPELVQRAEAEVLAERPKEVIPKPNDDAKTVKKKQQALRDWVNAKIEAWMIETVLWSSSRSGASCPLACEFCQDSDDPNDTMHRCASKPGRMYGRGRKGLGPTLYIGIH